MGTALGGLLQGLQHVGGGLIHIHQGDEASIDPETSRLYDGYVSQPVSDSPTAPEVFVVSFDHDANPATPPIQVSFELDRDGTTQPGNVVIPFSYGDTHEEIGQKIALRDCDDASTGPAGRQTTGGRPGLPGRHHSA